MVVWHDSRDGSKGWSVYGARVAKNGTVLDSGGFLISASAQNQEHTNIGFDGTNYLVAWYDWRPNADQIQGSLYGARVSPSGAVLDSPAFQISAHARGQVAPSVRFDGSEFLVVWQDDNAFHRATDIFARRVSKSGLPSQRMPITTFGLTQFGPVMGFLNDTFLIAWSDDRCFFNSECKGIYGQLVRKQSSSIPPEPQSVSTPQDAGWVTENPPSSPLLYDIWGSAANNVYAVGEGGVVLHYDGIAWSNISTPETLQRGRNFGVWGSGLSDVWIVAWCHDRFHFNGFGWNALGCSSPEFGGYGIWGSSATNIMTVGSRGAYFQYDGNNWQEKNTGYAGNLWDVWGSAANNVYAVGDSGAIYRFDGAAWTRQTGIPTLQTLNAVWGAGANRIIAVGDFGTILYYNGSAWTAQASGTVEHLFGVWGLSATDVYAVGRSGTILHYDGNTWSAQTSGTTLTLMDVWGFANTVWVVGEAGVILKRTLAGVCPYTLSQLGASIAAAGGQTSISVTAPAGCFWSAASGTAWITITSGGSGTGSGMTSFAAAANTGSTSRMGVLTIAGQSFTVTQTGVPNAYSLSPSSVTAGISGGSGSVSVTPGPPGASWAAVSNAAWISITSGTSGTGAGTVNYTVGANPGPPRVGALSIAGQTFTVTQDGVANPLGFFTVTPCRVADTRTGARMTAGSTRVFDVPTSSCNIPSDAQAYSLNVTVVPPGPLTYLTIWPAGRPQPFVSTLNSFDGAVIANAAIVPAGAGGAVSVYVSDATDVILDINGYFNIPPRQ